MMKTALNSAPFAHYRYSVVFESLPKQFLLCLILKEAHGYCDCRTCKVAKC